MKTVVTVTGIRPDFIRMSEIFKKLDAHFNHILIHTGQHFDSMLSDVFFQELNIRKPDYNLNIGGLGKEHQHQTADLIVRLIDLLRDKDIHPDIILFLGDSNSVMSAPVLRKEGYRIGHIEAGMRSYDKRMLEEINRICCDHSSNMLFTYHENYKEQLVWENIPPESIYVVGNTIVEVANQIAQDFITQPKEKGYIILDIHRPENFRYKDRLVNIIKQANDLSGIYHKPVLMLGFPRTLKYLQEFNISLGDIETINLLSYKAFLKLQYHALFMISDSGTAQEEPALLNTPVLVPRDYTERPESYENDCSHVLRVASSGNNISDAIKWLDDHFSGNRTIKNEWLGNGKTSQLITDILLSN